MQCVGSADAVPVSQCPLHAQGSCLRDCVDASFSSFSLLFSLAADRYCHQTDSWSLAFCCVLNRSYSSPSSNWTRREEVGPTEQACVGEDLRSEELKVHYSTDITITAYLPHMHHTNLLTYVMQ